MEMDSLDNSIVVCAFNEEPYILQCLNSIKKEIKDRKDTELIIVDNESYDLTENIVLDFIKENEHDLNIQYFRINHVPLTSSRNTAISYCKGDFIMFVDADATVKKDWLDGLLVEFNKSVSIVAGNVKNLCSGSPFSEFIYNSHFKCSLKLGSKLIGANMAFKKKVFESTGGFHSFVKNRGDETLLAQEYFRNNPTETLGYSKESIVYNAFPNGIMEWLKQQFEGGKSYILIQKFNKKNYVLHLHMFFRIANVLFIPHVFIHIFFIHSPFILIHILVFIMRNIYRVKYLHCGIQSLYRKKGFIQPIVFLPVAVLGMFSVDFGCVVEMLSFGTKVDRENAELGVVIKEVKTNYYKVGENG